MDHKYTESLAETKPNIVVDIDEILADLLHSFVRWHNAEYGTHYVWKDFHTYKLWDTLDITPVETGIRVGKFFKDEGLNIKLVKGSKEGIDKISRIARLHVVTGRNENNTILTKSWLDRYFPGKFSSIEFTSHYYKEKPVRKSEICKKLKAKIIIEDDESHIIDCADNGITVIVLDRSWNHNIIHKKIIRVKSWESIVTEIKKLMTKQKQQP